MDPRIAQQAIIAAEDRRRAAAAADKEREAAAGPSTGQNIATGARNIAEGTMGIIGDAPGIASDIIKGGYDLAGVIPFSGWTPEKSEAVGQGTKNFVGAPNHILRKALEMAGIMDPSDDPNAGAFPTTQTIHDFNSTNVLPEDIDKYTSAPAKDMGDQATQLATEFAPGMLTGRSEVKVASEAGKLLKALSHRLLTREALPVAGQMAAGEVTDFAQRAGKMTPETANLIKLVTGLGTGAGGAKLDRLNAAKNAAALVGKGPDSVRQVYKALQDDGMDSAAAIAKLDELGFDARLLDTGPTVRKAAADAYKYPGEGRNEMKSFLTDRQSLQGDNLSGIRAEAFGPDVNRDKLKKDINKDLTTEGQGYGPAHANQQSPVDSQSLVDWIDNELVTTSDDAPRKNLQDVRNSLHIQDKAGTTGNLDPSTQKLIATRNLINGRMRDAEGRPKSITPDEKRQLSDMYDQVNQLLETHNPDIRAIDARREQLHKAKDAFDTGYEALQPGNQAKSGAEFADTLAEITDPAHREKVKEGMNRYISGRVDLSTTEKSKLQSIVGSDYNRSKIEQVIGPERAAELERGLKSMDEFTSSYNEIVKREPAAKAEPRQPGVTEGAPLAAGATFAATGGNVPAAAGAGGAVVSRNFLRNKLAGIKKDNKMHNEISQLLVSPKAADTLRAAELIEQADSRSALPQSLLQGLIARQAEEAQQRNQPKKK